MLIMRVFRGQIELKLRNSFSVLIDGLLMPIDYGIPFG